MTVVWRYWVALRAAPTFIAWITRHGIGIAMQTTGAVLNYEVEFLHNLEPARLLTYRLGNPSKPSDSCVVGSYFNR
jgi:hypothetical protein